MHRPKRLYCLAFWIEFPRKSNRENFRRNRELIWPNREFPVGISEPLHGSLAAITPKAPSIVVATEGFLPSD